MKRVVWCASLFALVGFALFVVNQTAQIVALAHMLHPALGHTVLIVLVVIYVIVITVPVVLIARLPAPLLPPPDEASTEYATYLSRLRRRLAANPHLAGSSAPSSDRASLEAALEVLRGQARETMKRTAAKVFVSTAISQNGRLDALMVLVAQSRMVWQVAHIYNQRPTLREMAQLYANVGATVFVAAEIEDLDISEQIEPLITTVLGESALSLVPGARVAAAIVTRSLLEGAANAYLTLRIGAVCERYCAPLSAVSRGEARRYASVVAAGMLGTVVSGSAAVVVKAIVAAVRKRSAEALASGTIRMRSLGSRMNPFKRPARPGGEPRP
jgi:uncharacterized protein DUF697